MRGALLAALALVSCHASPASKPPPLHVMTALPLFLPEGDVAEILQNKETPPSVIVHLAQRWQVRPLDVARPDTLLTAETLLLIQPPALAADELVALDDWVRAGGRAVILADPELQWPTSLPLGDPRRAPPTSLLGPLFAHWGVRLVHQEAAGERPLAFAGEKATMLAAGRWQVRTPDCAALRPELLRCRIGRGDVFLVSDVDWLRSTSAESSAFDLLDALLARLGRPQPKNVAPHAPEKQHAKGADSP